MQARLRLIQLGLLCAAMLPAVVHAQFLFVSTNYVITITGYTGPDGAVVVPKKISGLPVAIIGTSAFANLTNLTSVTLPDTVTKISAQAFYNCTGLTNVTLGNGITTIENYAFEYCSNLSNVTMPASIQRLGEYAFAYCTNLNGAYFQGNAFTVSGSQFISDTHAVVYYFPWTSGWGLTFANTPTAPYMPPVPYNYVNNSGTITITQYTGPGGTVTVPATIYDAYANKFYPVTSIGANAFAGCSGLTSVSISSGVASIGTNAFAACTSLISVAIPNSVTNIGSYAFADCTNLTGAFFAGNAPSADATVFSNDNNAAVYCQPGSTGWSPFFGGAQTVQLPFLYTVTNGTIGIGTYTGSGGTLSISGVIGGLPVTSIGNGAFAFCGSLTNVNLPDSITDIGNGAFAFCGGLTSITMPDSVTDFGMFTFYACSNLVSVALSTNIQDIGVSAFDSCIGLTNVSIPDGVFIIGASAFQNCSSLTGMLIPAGVASVGSAAFDSCSNLTAITVDPQNTYYTDADGALMQITNFFNPSPFGNNSNPTLVQCPAGKAGNYIVPNGVITIGNSAFHACTRLTSVTIPNTVTGIGDFAFDCCSALTSVAILSTNAIYLNIGSYVFASCSNLNNVIIPNTVNTAGPHLFDNCVSLTDVTVGSGLTGSPSRFNSANFSDCPNLASIYLTGYYFSWIPTNSVATPTAYYLPSGAIQGPPTTITGLPLAPWLPRILTADGHFGFQTNQFGFNLTWVSGRTVMVEACTNLTQPVWSPVGTNLIFNGLSYFSDSQWTNYPGSIYRIRY
jgi:hypothetical protein